MRKLAAISYGLFSIGGIALAFALLYLYGMLRAEANPPQCYGCMPFDFKGIISFQTTIGLIFVTIGAIVKYADYENAKAMRKYRTDVA